MTKFSDQNILGLIGTILLAGIFFFFQPEYLPQHPTDWLGLLLLPFIANEGISEKKWIYLFLAILSVVLSGGESKILNYTFVCTLLLFWWEILGFRLNWLPMFMLLVIAPLTRQLVFVWSFPIRMELGSYAGKALSAVGFTAEVIGNTVFLNGAEFSVDAACTGLKMISIALVFGLFILAYYEKKRNRRLNFFSVGLFLFGVLALTLLANFSRLLALIIFHIAPENILHEAMGLAALLLYVLLPAFALGKYYVHAFGKEISVKDRELKLGLSLKKSLLLLSLLALFVLENGFRKQFSTPKKDPRLAQLQMPTYEKSILKSGVAKFEKEHLLVYWKPPISSLGMAHDPRYCWEGAGWKFKHIHKTTIGDIPVFSAEIEKDSTILKTVWWYDNGDQKTIEESEWRWNTLLGKSSYSLVNVTADDEGILDDEVQRLYTQNLFK